ncbi:hypothetical protein DTQ13_04325 [Parasaccharibacter sp. TMW 2.1888]|uniref:hypothetical protein n=1 Tax=Parasaccharibacter sp. TMW 2.1888 TaxID=2268025 RepID=UPI00206B1A97|nr:hypothetical protein [Parasaccharibacter sp. TMW 2.1888]UPO79650.1 hypothetical protein DTQ13_04325 [Parasaccharibacter sp. TMW 2.1888]
MNTDHTDQTTSPPLWLLDATGQMLGHDTLNDRIIRQLFDTRAVPGLSLHLQSPLTRRNYASSPIRAHFRKQASLPFPLPEIDVFSTLQDSIALRCVDGNQGWISIGTDLHEIHFDAPKMTPLGYFLPLTGEALLGLAMLFDRGLASVRTADGTMIGPASFLSEKPHGLALGPITTCLADHLETLIQLGRLPPGQELSHSFGQDHLTFRRAD